MTPRHLRVYANRSSIVDFSEAESTKPHLNISLLEGETGVVEYPVRVAAFTSVHSLSLYFVSRSRSGIRTMNVNQPYFRTTLSVEMSLEYITLVSKVTCAISNAQSTLDSRFLPRTLQTRQSPTERRTRPLGSKPRRVSVIAYIWEPHFDYRCILLSIAHSSIYPWILRTGFQPLVDPVSKRRALEAPH